MIVNAHRYGREISHEAVEKYFKSKCVMMSFREVAHQLMC